MIEILKTLATQVGFIAAVLAAAKAISTLH